MLSVTGLFWANCMRGGRCVWAYMGCLRIVVKQWKGCYSNKPISCFSMFFIKRFFGDVIEGIRLFGVCISLPMMGYFLLMGEWKPVFYNNYTHIPWRIHAINGVVFWTRWIWILFQMFCVYIRLLVGGRFRAGVYPHTQKMGKMEKQRHACVFVNGKFIHAALHDGRSWGKCNIDLRADTRLPHNSAFLGPWKYKQFDLGE